MKRPLLMPKLGLTMTEGALVEWMVRPGEAFAREATLFVVETEKTATDIPADADGVLLDVAVEAGVTVPVGTLLGHWDDAAPGEEAASPASPAEASAPAASGVVRDDATRSAAAATSAYDTTLPAAHDATPARVRATPLARRLARSSGVDLASLVGSGPRGRIRARDVEMATASTTSADVQLAATQTRAAAPPDERTASTPSLTTLRVPTSTESTIARRLVAAKRDIPHFYLSVEAEVSRLAALREELRAARPDERFTLNHFIVAAVARALAETPLANVVWTDAGIVQFATVDVGMAVATSRGLVAPVLRDIGQAPLARIAQQSGSAIERARAGRLTAAEMEGGAITVSNAGMHDVTYMTSIINPGQSLILGVGSVRELFRPGPAGEPLLRREMGLVLSADHRVHDAVGALALLKRIVAHLEQPLRLVL